MANLGYEIAGSTGDGWGAGEMAVWGPWTMSENGTLTEAHPAVATADAAVIRCVVYNDDGSNAPGTLFGWFASFTVPDNVVDFKTVTTSITGSTALVSGSKYHIGLARGVGQHHKSSERRRTLSRWTDS